MSAADLPALVKRLEAAVSKLESQSSGGAGATAGGAGASSGPSSAGVAAFDELLAGDNFATYYKLSAEFGGLVNDQANLVQGAFGSLKALIAIAAAHKKPSSPVDLQVFIKPLQEAMAKIADVKEKNRSSPQINLLSTIADGIPALGWVVVEPAPGPYVGEMINAAQFYANRVLKEYKDKDQKYVDWVNNWVAGLNALQTYVKKFHTTGLAWNPKGADPKGAPAPTAAPAPAAAAAAPVTAAAATPAPAKPPMGNLFGELKKGEGVTGGLKHVDKSQMTHKNPELRASSVVPAAASAPAASAAKAAPVSKGPPKLALEGNKWVVENYVGNNDVVVDKTDLRHVVYIYNCQNSTIKITGKVNAVTMDNCKKCGLLVESAVSTVDLVNSKSVQLQITGKAPTVAIDKTDGAQLFLSNQCLEIEVLTAKSSEINVSFEEKGELIEKAVPEQLKTTIVGGKLNTIVVEHKA